LSYLRKCLITSRQRQNSNQSSE